MHYCIFAHSEEGELLDVHPLDPNTTTTDDRGAYYEVWQGARAIGPWTFLNTYADYEGARRFVLAHPHVGAKEGSSSWRSSSRKSRSSTASRRGR